jgi:hypothetical protein
MALQRDVQDELDIMAQRSLEPDMTARVGMEPISGDMPEGGLEQEVAPADIEIEEQPVVAPSDLGVSDETEQLEIEGVQVAGIGDVVTGVTKKLARRVGEAEKRGLPPLKDEPIQEIGGVTIVREATDEEVRAINDAFGGEYTKGINFPAIAEGIGEQDMADYLARLKDANAELFEKQRRGTLNYDALMKMAEQRGMDNVVSEWLARTPGSGEVAEDVLAGMLGAMQMQAATKEAFQAARQIVDPEERAAAYSRAKKMMTVEASLFANISGAATEAGRTLYALREAQKQLDIGDSSQRAEQLMNLFGAKDAQNLEYLGEMYLALPDPAKSKFVQQSLGAKSMDAVIEVWINSLLTSPVTHAVNIAGNTIFAAMRTLETAVAGSMVGPLRTKLVGGGERVRAREAIAQLEGIRAAITDSIVLSGRTLLTEEPSDVITKIDIRNRRAIGTTGDPREVIDMLKRGEIGPAAVNTYGIYARLGGRFLIAEDEFFKGIGYRASLHQQADIRAGNLYDQLIDAGKTADEARRAAAAEKVRVISNPPGDVVTSARQAARELTFQGDLPGIFGKMQGTFSHPLAKLFVPFYKTPVGVVGETFKRSPAVLAHPNFYKALKAGGREADMALSRLATGSAIMGAFAYASMGFDTPDSDVLIIGSGPADPRVRQAMQRQGLQPFSINFKQEDGTYRGFTFSRLDPLSGMLSMAADFAYYAQYEEDTSTLEALALAASVGISEYAMEMPFLQGTQQLMNVIGIPNPAERIEAFIELMAEKGTGAVFSLAPTVSSFSAGVERLGDPTRSSSMLPRSGLMGEDPTTLPSYMRGFYVALQKAKARNPFFSSSVEPALNLWGEEMEAGEGYAWEFINPVRVKDSKYSLIDEEFMALGQGPAMNPRKIDGVLLNAKQYNRWLRIQNDMDANGKFPGEEGYNFATTLKPQLAEMVRSKEYKSLPSKADKYEELSLLIGQYRSQARRMLLAEDVYLGNKVLLAQ